MSKEKVLWIAKESFTGMVDATLPFFSDFDNEVVFVHPTEVLCSDPTYLNFRRRHPKVKIHSYTDVIDEYLAFSNDVFSDLEEYLKKYEGLIGLNELRMSSQLFTTPYHFRKYFRDLSEREMVNWITTVFRHSEKILASSKPSYIFDFDNSELARSVLWMIASKKSIPYISIEHSRYKGYVIPNFSLNRRVDDFFKDFMISCEPTEKTIKQIKDFRASSRIANEDFKHNNTLKKTQVPFLKHLRRIITNLIGVTKKHMLIVGLNRSYKSLFFIANPWQSYVHFIRSFVRERFLLSRYNKMFSGDIGDKYIYFPLHLIPESSTLIKAPYYPNEESIISHISKVLPLGYQLIVKEHGAMIGERPLSFYRRINRLHNVKCGRLNTFSDPKGWIVNSSGVITITGTSAFEAVMLGKRAIVLGTTPFENTEGIIQSNMKDLNNDILELLNDVDCNNVSSCAAYVETLQKFGKRIQWTRLHNECYSALLKDGVVSKEPKKDLRDLADVFKIGIEQLSKVE